MKFQLPVAVFLLLSCSTYAQETLLFQESFEDSTAIKAQFTGKFYASQNDYFHLSNKKISNTTAPYSNYDGEYYWAAEDIDALGGPKNASVFFNSVYSRGYTKLTGKVLVATGNESGSFDRSDSLVFYCSTNGGLNYHHVLKFAYESNGDAFNEIIRQDTNFDGNGDGSILTTVFQEFEFELPDADSVIIKAVFTIDADTEELAIDNFRIYGTDILTSTHTSISKNILISPNPFNNMLNVSVSDQDLTITDLMGKVFFEGKADNGSVNTQHFPNGIYMLRIQNQKEVFKIVKN